MLVFDRRSPLVARSHAILNQKKYLCRSRADRLTYIMVRRKKENRILIFTFVFFRFCMVVKNSWGIVLFIQWNSKGFFVSVLSHFVAIITELLPYMQVAILNLTHPYLCTAIFYDNVVGSQNGNFFDYHG